MKNIISFIINRLEKPRLKIQETPEKEEIAEFTEIGFEAYIHEGSFSFPKE